MLAKIFRLAAVLTNYRRGGADFVSWLINVEAAVNGTEEELNSKAA